jgi:hypothetical protein
MTSNANPILFIALPDITPNSWKVQNVYAILASAMLGEIDELTVKVNNRGEEYAVAHLEGWFSSAKKHRDRILSGKHITISADSRRNFVIREYKERMTMLPIPILPTLSSGKSVILSNSAKYSVETYEELNAPQYLPLTFENLAEHIRRTTPSKSM